MAANTSCVEYTHIVEVLLGDQIQVRKAIEGANIPPRRRELIEFLRDHNKFNALKWKNWGRQKKRTKTEPTMLTSVPADDDGEP